MHFKQPQQLAFFEPDDPAESISHLDGVLRASDRILIVDDEPEVLDGYRRILHGVVDLETSLGAERGLATLRLFGPFAIVISDMLMPGMNGAEFLSLVRQIAPNTVRMLLTGFKDIDHAIEAVNEGRIFRYLTKPCAKNVLVHAISLGLSQYHSNVEQSELLNQAEEIRHRASNLCQLPFSYGKKP